MASYEQEEGRKNVPIARYFRSDYVGVQVLKAVIYATLACMIVFGVYIYYDYENFIIDIYKMTQDELVAKGLGLLKYYAVAVVGYSVAVYFVALIKYNQSKKNLKRYFNNLKLLNSMYAKEARQAEMSAMREGK